MKILLYMGGGFDTYGPSRHVRHSKLLVNADTTEYTYEAIGP